MRRIVLTGGPCSGKTEVVTALAASMPNVIAVPEAATQAYSAAGTRWDFLDLEGKRDRQRNIYQLQLRQEEQFAQTHPGKTLLLDRGTVDGAAYWPDGDDIYWPQMRTTHSVELARYDLVILLETAAAIGVYGLESNAARFEDAAAAIANSRLLTRLWSPHPHLVTVPASPTLAEKINAVRRIVAGATEPLPH